MKTAVKEILGQQITGVIVKHANESKHRPTSMLMLVFEDDTYYEFYTHEGRLRPRQIWKMANLEQLRAWGEDQLWTEMIAWLDQDDGDVHIQMMDRDGKLKDM